MEKARKRNTLGRSVSFEGVGLHGGKSTSVTVFPSDRDGILFLHGDRYFSVQDADFKGDGRGTELAFSSSFSIKTVEHLLSALAGLDIDDAVIEVSGEEIPVMDGCSLSFSQAFINAEICSRDDFVEPIEITAPLYLDDLYGDRTIVALPCDHLKISYLINYEDAAIGNQYVTMDITPDVYLREIAPCRTFALLREVEALRARGLARGGSLENSLVVDGENVMSDEGLRFPDEFVRHKVLDLIGDFSLLGRPLKGHIIALKAGHYVHQQMVKIIDKNSQEAIRYDKNR